MANNCKFQMWIKADRFDQTKALDLIQRNAEAVREGNADPWFFYGVLDVDDIVHDHGSLMIEGVCANSMRHTIFISNFEKLVRNEGLWVEAFSEEPSSEVQEHFVYEAGKRTIADERAWGIYDVDELINDPVEMSRVCNMYKCSPDYIKENPLREGFNDIVLGGYGIWEPRYIDAKLSARESSQVDEGRTFFQMRAFGEDEKLDALGDKIARYPYSSKVQNIEFEHIVQGQLDVSGEIESGGVQELLENTTFMDDLQEADAVADIQSLGTKFYTRDHYVVSGDRDSVFHERDYGFPMLDENRAKAAIARATKESKAPLEETRGTTTLKAVAEQVMQQEQETMDKITIKEQLSR